MTTQTPNEKTIKKIKKEILEEKINNCHIGSGDDEYYVQQVKDWFNQNRLINLLMQRVLEEAQKQSEEEIKLSYKKGWDAGIKEGKSNFDDLYNSFVEEKERLEPLKEDECYCGLCRIKLKRSLFKKHSETDALHLLLDEKLDFLLRLGYEIKKGLSQLNTKELISIPHNLKG